MKLQQDKVFGLKLSPVVVRSSVQQAREFLLLKVLKMRYICRSLILSKVLFSRALLYRRMELSYSGGS